jgi:hypothetical protein
MRTNIMIKSLNFIWFFIYWTGCWRSQKCQQVLTNKSQEKLFSQAKKQGKEFHRKKLLDRKLLMALHQ